jgi:SAM-dependent methyltransferase
MCDPAVFDGYAEEYDAAVQGVIGASGEQVEYFAELKVELARRYVAPERPTTVLDFGCGIGNTTRLLRDAFAGADVTGYDPSARSIEVATRLSVARPERLRFVGHNGGGAGDALPFAEASFELIFTANVFHHIERRDHRRWVSELRRVLRPTGQLLVFEHNPYNPLTRRVVRACPFDEGVVLLRPGYARRLLRQTGFDVVPPHYYFFFPRSLRGLRSIESQLRRVPLGAQYFVAGRPRPMPTAR